MDDNKNITGLQLSYTSSDDSNINLKINITCDYAVDGNLDQSSVQFHAEGSDYSVTLAHRAGCPVFQYSMLQKFFDQYKYVIAAVMIVLGLIFCFAGNALINLILFVASSIIAFFALVSLVYYIVEKANKEPSETVQWVIVGSSAVVGLLVGFAVKKYRSIGVACLAAWGGVAIGLLLTTTFFVQSPYAKYGIIIGCAIILAFFAFKVEKLVVIAITGLLGSYMIVRGISLYAGGFPNEMALGDEIKNGGITFDQFPKTFYGYLAGIGVCAIVGIVVQVKQNKHKDNQNR